MGILDTIRTTVETVNKVHDAEIKSELLSEIISLQTLMLELQSENEHLKDELKSKTDKQQLRELLYFAQNAYWRRDENEIIAYCSGCFDNKGSLITLHSFIGRELANCPVCRLTIQGVYKSTRPSLP
jgi:hypothetical protein